ncbi:Heparanase-like protein 1 [Linum perenne]
MGLWVFSVIPLAFLHVIVAQDIMTATVVVNGAARVAETDDNYVCATLDWWPHDKCDYNHCPWGYTSAVNLDFKLIGFQSGFVAFGPLRIRIGGSLQDQVLYDVGKLGSTCHSFFKMKWGLFGFSKGCLHMDRWDSLNNLFSRTGAMVTFGLNALRGRHKMWGRHWGGPWNSTNTYDFISYTISKGHKIDSWEYGNELSGTGIGANVHVDTYAKDVIKLKEIIDELYKNSKKKPSIIAPGGFFEKDWYAKLLKITGPGTINVVTHHIYNLGAGVDPHLIQHIMDPNYLSRVSKTFGNLSQTIQQNGPWASAWVGESGGAYNSGGFHISDTFVNSFWYLDQLGLAATYNTKVYCRQTLVGGHYSLLNTTTFVPNPDYYRQSPMISLVFEGENCSNTLLLVFFVFGFNSALLWHRLMGKTVLDVTSTASPYLRYYAHCSKGRQQGITVLLINLSNSTRFIVNDRLKKSVSWIGSEATDGSLLREEYHLSPKDGNLRSKIMLLNGNPLQLTEKGDIPKLEPMRYRLSSPLYISSSSISFIVLPNFGAQACA